MITGAHFVLLSKDPEADRAFFRDVLKFHSVDIGDGWLPFRVPPAELAVHPSNSGSAQSDEPQLLPTLLYLMCDDLNSTIESLKAKQIACTSVTEAAWGLRTTLRLQSGGEIGLYQAYHTTALNRAAQIS